MSYIGERGTGLVYKQTAAYGQCLLSSDLAGLSGIRLNPIFPGLGILESIFQYVTETQLTCLTICKTHTITSLI